MKIIAMVLGLVAGMLPVLVSAEPIRHPGDAKSPILSAVTVPAGSTLVFLSGQVASPINPSQPNEYGDTKTQAVNIFQTIEKLLADRGMQMKDVIKLTVFLVGDPKLGGKMDFKGFSEAYAQFFSTAKQPNKVARSTVQVEALVYPPFLVEIEAVAAK